MNGRKGEPNGTHQTKLESTEDQGGDRGDGGWEGGKSDLVVLAALDRDLAKQARCSEPPSPREDENKSIHPATMRTRGGTV